ncbi:MAG: putative Type pilus pilin [Candidatus Kaiserbacteria bacterium]|nr:putative Type pilus pilin [Candidatus Kaiserbacteria bacterium]
MIKSYKKGFTLIELLVVIAIIGILAAVVLASLGTARSKGVDAAVKDNMSSMRGQAELYSTNNNNSYTGVCADATFLNMLTQTKSSDTYATGANNTTYGTAGSAATITCHATSTAWAVEAPLSTGNFWCVDSTGNAASTTLTTLPASDSQCN